MPPDERVAKAADRCAIHPGRPRAATCDRCGRGLCIVCAVPVRGVAYGPECLRTVLGDDAPPEEPSQATRSTAERIAGVAILVALAASLAPWTLFGAGSGWFHGAWALDARWSMLAAPSALIGSVAWWGSGPRGYRWGRVVCVVACAGVALGSALAIANPPPFTKAALAPWIALAAAVVALSALVIAARSPGSSAASRREPDRSGTSV
jgi:hypothetical protein